MLIPLSIAFSTEAMYAMYESSKLFAFYQFPKKVPQDRDSKVTLPRGKLYFYLFSVYRSPDMAARMFSGLSLSDWLLTDLIH